MGCSSHLNCIMSHYFSLFSSSLWFVTADFDSVAVDVVVLYVVALPLFVFRLFLLLALMENLFIIIHLDPLILILCCYRLGHYYYLLVLLLLPLLLLMLVQQGLPHCQMQFDLWRL